MRQFVALWRRAPRQRGLLGSQAAVVFWPASGCWLRADPLPQSFKCLDDGRAEAWCRMQVEFVEVDAPLRCTGWEDTQM